MRGQYDDLLAVNAGSGFIIEAEGRMNKQQNNLILLQNHRSEEANSGNMMLSDTFGNGAQAIGDPNIDLE